MTKRKVLLLGFGGSYDKRIHLYSDSTTTDWRDVDWRDIDDVELTTLDINPAHKPDIVCDLNDVLYLNGKRLIGYPFEDNTFDRIDAYEILEHLGQQGDIKSFFLLFYELWRILKPGGVICATTPSWRSIWAWGDPGHRRIISSATLVFLDQNEYQKQVGHGPMSDYREHWQGDFEGTIIKEDDSMFAFTLTAIKPARL